MSQYIFICFLPSFFFGGGGGGGEGGQRSVDKLTRALSMDTPHRTFFKMLLWAATGKACLTQSLVSSGHRVTLNAVTLNSKTVADLQKIDGGVHAGQTPSPLP